MVRFYAAWRDCGEFPRADEQARNEWRLAHLEGDTMRVVYAHRRSSSLAWPVALLCLSATACEIWGESDETLWEHGVLFDGQTTLEPGTTAVAAWAVTEVNVPAHIGRFRLSLDTRFIEAASSAASIELRLTAAGSSSTWSEAQVPVRVPRDVPASAVTLEVAFGSRVCDSECVDRVELNLVTGTAEEEPPLQIDWSGSLGLYGREIGAWLPDSAIIDVQLEGL